MSNVLALRLWHLWQANLARCDRGSATNGMGLATIILLHGAPLKEAGSIAEQAIEGALLQNVVRFAGCRALVLAVSAGFRKPWVAVDATVEGRVRAFCASQGHAILALALNLRAPVVFIDLEAFFATDTILLAVCAAHGIGSRIRSTPVLARANIRLANDLDVFATMRNHLVVVSHVAVDAHIAPTLQAQIAASLPPMRTNASVDYAEAVAGMASSFASVAGLVRLIC